MTLSSSVAGLNLKLAETVRFWNKPEVFETMTKSRKIVVSVTHEAEQWNFRGAGQVEASADFCVEQAKNFSRLEAVPEHFYGVVFSEKDSVLKVIVKFIGKEYPLSLKLGEVRVLDRTGEWTETQIFFQNQDGVLVGLEGVLLISKGLPRQSPIIGIIAQYRGSPVWVPDWIFSLTGEAVMHYVSLSLRNTLEKDYKK